MVVVMAGRMSTTAISEWLADMTGRLVRRPTPMPLLTRPMMLSTRLLVNAMWVQIPRRGTRGHREYMKVSRPGAGKSRGKGCFNSMWSFTARGWPAGIRAASVSW